MANRNEVLLLLLALEEDERKRKRELWVHDINKERQQHGEFWTLYPLLRKDENNSSARSFTQKRWRRGRGIAAAVSRAVTASRPRVSMSFLELLSHPTDRHRHRHRRPRKRSASPNLFDTEGWPEVKNPKLVRKVKKNMENQTMEGKTLEKNLVEENIETKKTIAKGCSDCDVLNNFVGDFDKRQDLFSQ
ncbi:hypothetical protein ACJJTC_010777 [Scirpophaga incertulas]